MGIIRNSSLESCLHNISHPTLFRHKTRIIQGYFWVYMPHHPRANRGYVKQAILTLEDTLDRQLRKGEFPHHIDGNTLNDAPENLEPPNRSEHFATHRLLEPIEYRLKHFTEKAKKLCAEDVIKIREMRKQGMKMKDIADHFHVGRTAIHDVVYGKCWAYIK